MVNRTAALDGKWREGKVRPIPGNSPHDRLVSRGIFHRQGELATIPSPPLPSGATIDIILRRLSMRFPGRAESIGPMWFKTKKQSQNQIPGREPTASRRSAPSPGKRTRREDHALLIVRDEFRTGYSLIGLLASIARLRFTGTRRLTYTPESPAQKRTFLLCQQEDISTLP